MSTATSGRLEFSDALSFLSYLYSAYGWDRFLIKNTFDLTPGYPAIPAQKDRYGISYDINDLKTLAYDYGQGKVSKERIEQRAGEFMNKFEITKGASSDKPSNDEENATLHPVERLDQAIDAVALLAKALYTINIAIGTVGMHIKDGEVEREALRRVTEDYYHRAYEIVGNLDVLREELFEAEEPKFSVEDIEALMGEMETM